MKPSTSEFAIPCKGRWTDTSDGGDYTCDYKNAGGFGCEECAATGGRMDPRTGKALRKKGRKKPPKLAAYQKFVEAFDAWWETSGALMSEESGKRFNKLLQLRKALRKGVKNGKR